MAIKEQDKVFYEEAENGDKIINLPITRANNVEGLGRSVNTYYSVGNVVYVDSNLSVALKCVTAGTTSSDELDISTASVGSTVEDGNVVWEVVSRISDSVPIGTIFAFGANEIPVGYLDCDGTAVSRLVYADLFAVIGTTYGSGDGSTTFNLPNLNNNSFLEGSNTVGTVKSAGLPNITGSISRFNGGSDASGSGAISLTYLAVAASEGSKNKYYSASFNASKSNSIYGNSTTVQPKSVTVKFCIKAYGAVTNTGSVELEEMAKDYEAIAQRTSVVEQTLPKKANLGALSMPSDNFLTIDVTNGMTYLAPTDGYICAYTIPNTADGAIVVYKQNKTLGASTSYTKNASTMVICPMKKGDKLDISWGSANTAQVYAWFTYAQSEV